jgi:hypothetical protein
MCLLFTLLPLAAILLIHSKQSDPPLPVFLFLGFFSLCFLITFLIKSFSHKEVELVQNQKKIIVRKKRFETILNENSFDLSAVKKVKIETITRKNLDTNPGPKTNSSLQIVMELNGGKEIIFSTVNSPDAAKELADKIRDFTRI